MVWSERKETCKTRNRLKHLDDLKCIQLVTFYLLDRVYVYNCNQQYHTVNWESCEFKKTVAALEQLIFGVNILWVVATEGNDC